jgi:hypothetical protein
MAKKCFAPLYIFNYSQEYAININDYFTSSWELFFRYKAISAFNLRLDDHSSLQWHGVTACNMCFVYSPLYAQYFLGLALQPIKHINCDKLTGNYTLHIPNSQLYSYPLNHLSFLPIPYL